MRRAENASPMQVAEEPPNLKNPNQRRRKLMSYGRKEPPNCINYSDASCTTLDNRFSGTYTNVVIGDNVTFADGTSGRKMSYDVQANEYTIFSATTASLLNSASYCGLTNWTTNTAVDIMGRSCLGVVRDVKNTTKYNFYNLMGNNLYLGTSKTDVYPTTVNTNVMYVKQ